jgi:type VI secretion system secreted protein Hcp
VGARDRSRRVWKAGLLIAVGIAGGATAVAVASVPDSNGVIHACYQVDKAGSTVPATSTGNLRIIDPSAGQTCNTVSASGAPGTEATIAWNQTGPPGPEGPAGPQGPAGKSVTIAGGNTLTIGGSVVTVGAPSGVTISVPAVGPNSRAIGTATVGGLGSFTILSLSLGTSNPTAVTGNAASRARISDIVITKSVDKSSPSLQRACVNGTHFPKVTIELRKGGKVYLTYTLKDVLVSSFDVSGHGNANPTETVSFSYAKLAIVYTKQS